MVNVCISVDKKIKYSYFLVCAALLLPFVFSKSQKAQDVLEKLELLDQMVKELNHHHHHCDDPAVKCGRHCCQWASNEACHNSQQCYSLPKIICLIWFLGMWQHLLWQRGLRVHGRWLSGNQGRHLFLHRWKDQEKQVQGWASRELQWLWRTQRPGLFEFTWLQNIHFWWSVSQWNVLPLQRRWMCLLRWWGDLLLVWLGLHRQQSLRCVRQTVLEFKRLKTIKDKSLL